MKNARNCCHTHNLSKHYNRSEQRLLCAVHTDWQQAYKIWSLRLSKKAAAMNNFDNEVSFLISRGEGGRGKKRFGLQRLTNMEPARQDTHTQTHITARKTDKVLSLANLEAHYL